MSGDLRRRDSAASGGALLAAVPGASPRGTSVNRSTRRLTTRTGALSASSHNRSRDRARTSTSSSAGKRSSLVPIGRARYQGGRLSVLEVGWRGRGIAQLEGGRGRPGEGVTTRGSRLRPPRARGLVRAGGSAVLQGQRGEANTERIGDRSSQANGSRRAVGNIDLEGEGRWVS